MRSLHMHGVFERVEHDLLCINNILAEHKNTEHVVFRPQSIFIKILLYILLI